MIVVCVREKKKRKRKKTPRAHQEEKEKDSLSLSLYISLFSLSQKTKEEKNLEKKMNSSSPLPPFRGDLLHDSASQALPIDLDDIPEGPLSDIMRSVGGWE